MKFYIIIISLLIYNFISFSQWQQDFRLTNDPQASNTSFNNAMCIASSGNSVHVVWFDYRAGNYEIYYKRSLDSGLTWGADIRLTNNSSASQYPCVSLSGQYVHVVWSDLRDGNWEIYYKRSTDGGLSWGAEIRLTSNNGDSKYPSVSVSGMVVHVVWHDTRIVNGEIYYKRSTDGGISWGTDTRLSNNPETSNYPTVSVYGSVIHVEWQDFRDGNYEIYYIRSSDGGAFWGTETRLTNSLGNSEFPSGAASGSFVHVVWQDLRDGNREIYYKRSTDNGSNWGADIRLTNDPAFSINPSISASGQVLHVVWQDLRDGNREIYYKRSTDAGNSWEGDVRLTNDPDISELPSVSISGQVVHVVWTDYRNGTSEIYYKRNPTGNPLGLKNIGLEVPENFSLSQNYPNPFNPSTYIKFDIPNKSFINLFIYDVAGRLIKTLVNEALVAGSYEVDFDGSNLSSGVYYCKLIADIYTETKKMVLIK